MLHSKSRARRPYASKFRQAPDNAGRKETGSAYGTPFAIKNRHSSGASDFNWGGTRNSANRTSSALTLAQAYNIIAATKYAAAVGLPFNRFLTIHWEQAGIPDSRAAWATGRFLKLANDWVASRGGRIAWAWVRENGDGKGSHVHILMHVPVSTGPKRVRRAADNTVGVQPAGLGNMPRRWLRLITGSRYVASTIKTERIGGTARAALTAPAAYEANLATVVGYVLKGACPAAVSALGLTLQQPGGVIIGKRAGTSQNVGRASRKLK